MVAEQVLRKAVAAAILFAALPARAERPVTIGLVDVGPGDRAARRARRSPLERSLETMQGIELVSDPALRAALAGERHAPQFEAGRRSLEAARTAFGRPDCPAAEREAGAALLSLAAAQAAGAEVTGELRQAYVFQLLCADQRADAASARGAAGALRGLAGPEPPEGVGEPVWSRYPAVDVTAGVRHVQLEVTSQPSGAAIWIDHQPVGKAPISATVTEGEHLVAAAGPSGAAAVRASGGTAPVALTIPAERAPWRKLEARVRGWQSRAIKRDNKGLATLLSSARLGYAVVIDERGRFTVWQRRGLTVRQLGGAPDALGLAALVQAAEQRRKNPRIDPDQPLMRETPEERAAYLTKKGKGAGPSKQEWWVYAAIVGAIAIGAGVVLANDLADDHQNFEITFP